MFKILFVAVIMQLAVTFTHTADTYFDGFYVQGQTLYESNGKPFVMRGINVPHSWFKDKTLISLKAVAATGSNAARIVLSNGQKWQKDSLDEVKKVIQACKDNQLIAVLDVHDGIGSDDIDQLNKAVNFWIEIKDALIGNEKYVILNIANEWAGSWNITNWKNGYVQAIPKLRAAGIKHNCMVDAAGWGQYPQSIFDYGTDVFEADILRNIIFSIHMYGYAGKDANTVRNNIDNVLNKNLTVVIGEFGNQHADGDVDEITIMDYSQEKRVGYFGWSWKGNNPPVEYLDIANTFDGASYTPWGNTLINYHNGIKATAKKASIFTDETADSSTNSVQYFNGSNTASPWAQAVSIMTRKNGGSIELSDIKAGGNFYVEYSGKQDSIELCLQSWSGGQSWVKVDPSETGVTKNINYAKFSYEVLKKFYTSWTDLDQVHVGAKESEITVYKLQYIMY